jgi:hypothetical protein
MPPFDYTAADCLLSDTFLFMLGFAVKLCIALPAMAR